MNSQKLSASIVQKIKTEKIKPKSKWYFFAKNSIFWFFFGLSILIGGFNFGVFLFHIEMSAVLDLPFIAPPKEIIHILKSLPTFWILAFVIFLGLSYFGFQATNRGYKISFYKILSFNLLGIILVGFGSYYTGIPEITETVFSSIPGYKTVEERRSNLWDRDDFGRMGGKIREIIKDNDTVKKLIIRNRRKKEWVIYTENAKIRPRKSALKKGRHITLRGEKIGENEIEAFSIRVFLQKQRHR